MEASVDAQSEGGIKEKAKGMQAVEDTEVNRIRNV